jgi:predicted DNA-binding antitoxin AbrB/MazE fold protein
MLKWQDQPLVKGGSYIMSPVEVIYENGILRPLSPLHLEEGTRLEVTMVKLAPATPEAGEDRVDEAAYVAFLDELDKVAALPLESPPQPYIAHNHDAILYPKHGEMP